MSATGARRARNDELAHRLVDSLIAVCRQWRAIKLPDGMTQERLVALASMAEHGPISITALAQMAKVRTPAMSRMVSSLVEDGLVSRRDDKTDGRGVLVLLTPRGRRVFKKAKQYSSRHLRQALGKLPRSQVSALAGLVSSLESLDSD